MNWTQFYLLLASIWFAPYLAEWTCTALGSVTLIATAHAWTHLS